MTYKNLEGKVVRIKEEQVKLGAMLNTPDFLENQADNIQKESERLHAVASALRLRAVILRQMEGK